MTKVLTTCGYCGCGCNFYVHVERGEIENISPKPDHVVSQGMLCAKGWLGHDFVTHEDRLLAPQLRQYDGSFVEVPWDTALDFIAGKLQKIRTQNPEAFAMFSSARCTNEENYLAAKLCRAVMGSPHIDHCARL